MPSGYWCEGVTSTKRGAGRFSCAGESINPSASTGTLEDQIEGLEFTSQAPVAGSSTHTRSPGSASSRTARSRLVYARSDDHLLRVALDGARGA